MFFFLEKWRDKNCNFYKYRGRNKIGSKVEIISLLYSLHHKHFDKYPTKVSHKYPIKISYKYLECILLVYSIEISYKYLECILLVSKTFRVHNLYKKRGKGNVKMIAEMTWKTGGKAEKPEKRLERKVSQVLRTKDLLYL